MSFVLVKTKSKKVDYIRFVRNVCNDCTNERKRILRAKNPESRDVYSETNRDKINQRQRAYNRTYKNEKHKRDQTPRGRFLRYKNEAKRKNVIFELTEEQVTSLTSSLCFYCGLYSEDRNYCGIDKVQPELGYVLNNCVPCCAWCNKMKWKQSKDKFYKKIVMIYDELKKKELI